MQIERVREKNRESGKQKGFELINKRLNEIIRSKT